MFLSSQLSYIKQVKVLFPIEEATVRSIITYSKLKSSNMLKQSQVFGYTLFFFFFYLGFLSRTFTIHGTAGEGGGYLFNSSLPLPPASQTFRHYPGDYCRELTSAHSWQPDSNREPLVSERKSLTTKLRATKLCTSKYWGKLKKIRRKILINHIFCAIFISRERVLLKSQLKIT